VIRWKSHERFEARLFIGEILELIGTFERFLGRGFVLRVLVQYCLKPRRRFGRFAIALVNHAHQIAGMRAEDRVGLNLLTIQRPSGGGKVAE